MMIVTLESNSGKNTQDKRCRVDRILLAEPQPTLLI
jgi:hypothetical protein